MLRLQVRLQKSKLAAVQKKHFIKRTSSQMSKNSALSLRWQHELPNSISPAFIEWLDRGGHKIELKKNAMIVKKQFSDGVKRSVIPFERHEIKEFYELDEYLSQRYELFLKQYFNNGKGFIQDLHLAMASKYRKAVMMNNLAKVA